MHVNPVQQRPAQPRAIDLHLPRLALARFPRMPEEPARTPLRCHFVIWCSEQRNPLIGLILRNFGRSATMSGNAVLTSDSSNGRLRCGSGLTRPRSSTGRPEPHLRTSGHCRKRSDSSVTTHDRVPAPPIWDGPSVALVKDRDSASPPGRSPSASGSTLRDNDRRTQGNGADPDR